MIVNTSINKYKHFLVFLIFVFHSVLSVSALPFNNELSESDIQKANKGEVIIRNIGTYSKMSLNSDNRGAKILLSTIHDLQPSYLAEIIKVVPVKNNEKLPEIVKKLLMAIPDYAGIPYYSEQGKSWYKLYSSAEILSQTTKGDVTTLLADFDMAPFGIIHTSITIMETPDYLYYESTNLNKLLYSGFTCVSPEKMKSCIIIFRDGDNWILYGAGGVRAPWIPFLAQRIETSFINRIKTFCNFIFEKI